MKAQKIALLLLWMLAGCEGFPEFVGVDPVPAEVGKIDQNLAGVWIAQEVDSNREGAGAVYLHALPAKDRIHFLYLGAGVDVNADLENRYMLLWLAGEAFPFTVENYYLVRLRRLKGWYAEQVAKIAENKGDPPMEAGPYEPGIILASVVCTDPRCDALSLRWACDFERIIPYKRLAGRLLMETTAEKLVELTREGPRDHWCKPPAANKGQQLFHRIESWIFPNLDVDIQRYTQALSLDPKNARAYNELAWLYATASDPVRRNATLAVQFAKKALELVPEKSNYLDTAAAAYARTGDFEEAKRLQEKAIRLAKEQGNKRLNDYEKRLALYQAGQPYTETR